MPFTDTSYARGGFKRLNSLAHTSNSRDPGNESILSGVLVDSNAGATLIESIDNSQAQAVTDGTVEVITLDLTEVTGSNDLAYEAKFKSDYSGHFGVGAQSQLLRSYSFAIPKTFSSPVLDVDSDGYNQILKNGATQIAAGDPADWYFDVVSGVVVAETSGAGGSDWPPDTIKTAIYIGQKIGDSLKKSNLGVASDPTATDDDGDGYAIGSMWTNTSNEVWVCTDASTGAAVWTQADSSAGSGAPYAFKTIDCPSGTDPVASGISDTLTLSDGGGMTITGIAASDKIAFSSTVDGFGSFATDGTTVYAVGPDDAGTLQGKSGGYGILTSGAAQTVSFEVAKAALSSATLDYTSDTIPIFDDSASDKPKYVTASSTGFRQNLWEDVHTDGSTLVAADVSDDIYLQGGSTVGGIVTSRGGAASDHVYFDLSSLVAKWVPGATHAISCALLEPTGISCTGNLNCVDVTAADCTLSDVTANKVTVDGVEVNGLTVRTLSTSDLTLTASDGDIHLLPTKVASGYTQVHMPADVKITLSDSASSTFWVNTATGTGATIRSDYRLIVDNVFVDGAQVYTQSSDLTITAASNKDVLVTPAGTGVIKLDGTEWPSTVGSDNQVLVNNSSDVLTWMDLDASDLQVSGTTVMLGSQPAIGDFTNATHDHTDNSDGGVLATMYIRETRVAYIEYPEANDELPLVWVDGFDANFGQISHRISGSGTVTFQVYDCAEGDMSTGGGTAMLSAAATATTTASDASIDPSEAVVDGTSTGRVVWAKVSSASSTATKLKVLLEWDREVGS
jgi:hypothetical protein